jgi:hypothetical protein
MATECTNCGHPPIRHIKDGQHWLCLVCVIMAREGMKSINDLCTVPMTFKLSEREREQASKADRSSYPPHIVCAVCNYTWESHLGYLCPTGDDTFIPLLDVGFLHTH